MIFVAIITATLLALLAGLPFWGVMIGAAAAQVVYTIWLFIQPGPTGEGLD